MRRRSVLVGALVLAVGLSACGAPSPTSDGTQHQVVETGDRKLSPEPCPDGATVSLGSPFPGRDPASFETTGGELWVTAGEIGAPSGYRRPPGRSWVYIGTGQQPLSYDRSTGEVSGGLTGLRLEEDTWTATTLDAGTYDLWARPGRDLRVRSCEPDGVKPG